MSAKNKSEIVSTVAPSLAPICLDVKSAAIFISTTVGQIRSLKYSGHLRCFRIGKKDLFRIADLQDFVDRKAKEAA